MFWRAEEAADIRYSIGGMVGLFLAVMALMARSLSANYADALRLRFENLDLAEDLRRRNELVEQANLDKSRFLAAASHDLRQPIHALGLFVGALRATQLPPEAVRLVEQIEASAAAMDGYSARCSIFRASTPASSKCAGNPSRSSRCSTASAAITPRRRGQKTSPSRRFPVRRSCAPTRC